MTVTQMLKQLTDARPGNLRDYRNEKIDILQDGEIEDADAWGFTVHGINGRTEVAFPGGLTSKEYGDFSPLLDNGGKAVLAWGVLKNMHRSLPWPEWNTASTLMCQAYGNNESQWLPNIIEDQGFDAIAVEMKTRLGEYRRTNPPQRIRLAVVKTPIWLDAERVLVYGDMRRAFRSDADNAIKLLNILEKNDWRSVVVDLEYEQISQAAHSINLRTRPHITFRAATDCLVTWATQ